MVAFSEADVAGPWRIEEVPGVGFGLFREGERRARGFMPAAVFADRWLALLAAAVLPDEHLLDGLNLAVSLVRSPSCLAWLLEAAGSVALERCGAILDERVSEALTSLTLRESVS